MFHKKWIRSVAIAALVATSTTFSLPSDGWAQIDELIVSVRKREESLQDVPISVGVVGMEQLTRSGVTDLEDIIAFDSSMIFEQSFAQKDTRVTVRGLSPTRGRSNVAFLVDGIDVTTEAFNSTGAGVLISQRLLSDVQRVETVKGPQSALYGRAAFAGAVQYITRDASEEFEAEIHVEAAQFDEYEVRGSLSGPIVDGLLGARVSGYYWDEQGQYVNEITGAHIGGGEGFGVAGTINFDPLDNLSFKLRVEYSDDEYEPRAVVDIRPDELIAVLPEALAIIPGTGDPGDPGDDLSVVDTGPFIDNLTSLGHADGRSVRLSDNPRTPGLDYPGNDIEIFRASLVATWDDILSGSITSLTGYLQADTIELFDQDYQALPNGSGGDALLGGDETFNIEDVEVFSQELRYASDWSDMPFFGDSLQATFGLQYWMNQKNIDQRGQLVNCYQIDETVEGLASFFSLRDSPFGVPGIAVNPICQDFDSDDDPSSGPIDTWQEVFLANDTAGFNVPPQVQKIRSVHKSIYMLLEWQMNQFGLDDWKLSFENRWTDENFFIRRLAANICSFLNPFNVTTVCSDREGAFNFFGDPMGDGTPDPVIYAQGQKDSFYHTPKVTLEWMPADDLMVYFSAAHAKKPAGIEQLPPSGQTITDITAQFGFDTEKLNNYELGFKSSWGGGFGDLILNGALFFEDFSDKQVSVQRADDSGNLNRFTTNAGSVEVIGTEFDFVWQPPLEGLTFAGGYTWLPKAKYEELLDSNDSAFQITGAGNCVIEIIDTEPRCLISSAGKRLEMAPKHSASLRGSYTRPLYNSGINWFVEGDALYLSKRFDSRDNLTTFDSYHQLDLRAGLQAENWEVLLFVDNVTKSDTFRTGSIGAGSPDFPNIRVPILASLGASDTTGFLAHDFAVLPPRRQFGIRASLRY